MFDAARKYVAVFGTKSIAGSKNADGFGGIGAKPGGMFGVSPGGGVVPGCTPWKGFVKNDASDVMESIGSRSCGFFPFESRGVLLGVPSRFSLGELPLPLLFLLCPLSCFGDSGVAVDRLLECALTVVMGGLLWKRQKM